MVYAVMEMERESERSLAEQFIQRIHIYVYTLPYPCVCLRTSPTDTASSGGRIVHRCLGPLGLT